MSKRSYAAIKRKIEASKARIAKERDKLRELYYEAGEIIEDCDEALDDLERAADAMSAPAMTPAELEAHFANWTPTSENINALPGPLRKYIHDLHTNCDPAGMVRENVLLRERVEQLEELILEIQERQE